MTRYIDANRTSMRAAVLEGFGGPENIRLTNVPMPTVGDNDVLIRVEAVSVNRTLDLAVRAGTYVRPIKLPHVLGSDPSGVIVSIGSNVFNRKIGDRVTTNPKIQQAGSHKPVLIGVDVWGGYAEYVAVPAMNTHAVPDKLNFVEATVIARHAPLAINMLRSQASACEGETVLIMGASGGLGSAAIQVAKILGLKVIAAAGSDQGLELTRKLGADFAVNYRKANLTDEVLQLIRNGVDIVLENVGSDEFFPQAVAAMARNGRLVTAGAHGGGKVMLDVSILYLRHLTLIGSTIQTDKDVHDALRWGEQGRLVAAVDKIMSLADVSEAHHIVASRANFGKIVLVPGSQR